MTRRPALGYVVLVLSVGGALLAGCSSDVDASAGKGEPVREGEQYVALGDSFTAAPGVGEQTGPGVCVQTDANYPHLLAERLDLRLTDVSCGGATSDDLTEAQYDGGDGVPPQLDALTEDTDLVTLSIGANDADVFADVVTRCVQFGAVSADPAPCEDSGSFEGTPLADQLGALVDQTVENVGEVLERAPRARVIVVGYPQIVPAEGGCPELPLAPRDYPFAREVNQRLAAALESGARKAEAEYVDMWAISEGHDVCADEPWVAGLKPVKPAIALHPYAEHQAAVADALVELIEAGPPR